VAFSPDGKLLASMLGGKTAQVWSTETETWAELCQDSCAFNITYSGPCVCVWRRGQDKPERTFFARGKLECKAVSPVTRGHSRVWFAVGDKHGNVYMLGD